jgi:putative ABC transport system substrate-binding protein
MTMARSVFTILTAVVAVLLLVATLAVEAQQAGKAHRIGVLAVTSWPPFESFRKGLQELGYVEGRDIVIEYRWSEGRQDRLPDLAAELVRLNVDVIVTWGTQPTKAAKDVSGTVPIVMAASAEPVAAGLVSSLARPGGNVTGLAAHNPELEGKRMELLKELLPRLTRVALLGRRDNTLYPAWSTEARHAARRLGVQLQLVELSDYTDTNLKEAFTRMTRERAEALVVAPDTVAVLRRTQIAALTAQHRLPTIYLHTEHVHAGGLMAYGPNYHELFRRAASYVDRILKGARPADLPVERSTKFDLMINLKTARALGLTIPPSLLLRADQVIE